MKNFAHIDMFYIVSVSEVIQPSQVFEFSIESRVNHIHLQDFPFQWSGKYLRGL